MPKYKVEWNEGVHYTAEVIADNPEDALKEAVQHKKADKRFSNGATVVNESEGQLLKYCCLWNEKYGNASEKEALELLKTTDKPIVYTHGLEYRGPAVHRQPITKEKALDEVRKYGFDLTEEQDCVHVNTFSGSDWD